MTDPFALFDAWFAEATASELNDPNAMALATADAQGRLGLRTVLLKGHDARGFVFYTNQQSRKGADLAAHPQAALLFHWKSLRRQIRIEGPVSPVSDAEADAYFATRPRESQLGAWASDQSRPLASRALFEARFARAVAEGFAAPMPPALLGAIMRDAIYAAALHARAGAGREELLATLEAVIALLVGPEAEAPAPPRES